MEGGAPRIVGGGGGGLPVGGRVNNVTAGGEVDPEACCWRSSEAVVVKHVAFTICTIE